MLYLNKAMPRMMSLYALLKAYCTLL